MKKMIVACMTITAFAAFVLAPMASAAVLTENGVAVPVGASFTSKTTEPRLVSGTTTIVCSAADMSGVVTASANGTIATEIVAGNPSFTGTAVGGDCTSGGLGPFKWTVNSKLCLHVPKGTDIGTVTGCGTAAVTFTLNFTSSGLFCHYEKASIGTEITTAPADAAVKIIPGEKSKGETGNSPLCPAEFELQMESTLTTTDGTTLTFS
jgi:hypothetical protein